MTLKGKTMDALIAALSSSFFGACVSFVITILSVPVFLYLVTLVGAGERALFALWALIIICGGALTRDDMLRGLISMAVGLFIGTIGMQPNVGVVRYVDKIFDLWDGFNLIWVILGIYALPQMLRLPYIKIAKQGGVNVNFFKFTKEVFKYMKTEWKLMLKSSLLGTIIGAIPGIGATTAAWIGYSAAEKTAKPPTYFGKGDVRGIIGAESANNAAVPGTFIPLLALGIPGSGASAIMMGALISVGVYPGPALMYNNGPLVWTILFGIGLSAFVFLLLGVPFIKAAQKMVLLPSAYLIAFIGILSLLGTYLAKFSSFGILVTIVLGIVIVAGTKVGLLPSSVLLGYILGPTIETEFIRSYQIGGYARFMKPASLVLLILIVATLIWSVAKDRQLKKSNQKTMEDMSDKERQEQEYLKEIKDESSITNSNFGDFILSIVGFMFAFYIWYSLREKNIFVVLWPNMVAGVFIAIPCFLLLFRSVCASMRGNGLRSDASHAFLAAKNLVFSSVALDAVVIIGGMALSAVSIDYLGFTGASALFAAICLFYFQRKLVSGLLGVAAFGLFMYLMRVVFTFPLPLGILNL